MSFVIGTLFALYSILHVYMDRGKRIYCAFIDYKKAFDFVDRVSLWKKMMQNGINGKLLNVIYNMYCKAKSCVKNENSISDYFNCKVGVRQGENLSPMLFAIFLNDFEYSISRMYDGLGFLAGEISSYLSDDDIEHFLRIFALLYADDTIVLAESAEQLQLALNAVHKYCYDWDLTVNTDKTQIVIFSRAKVTNYPAFIFGHDLIKVVEDYTYLGVIFNYNGLFHKAINKQARQGKRAFFALLNKVRLLRLLVDLVFELFDSLVMPVLLYGSEVWGYSDIKQIEVLHRKFIKIILGVPQNTPNCMIYGESGRTLVVNIVHGRMVNFFGKMINDNHNKLPYIMYKLMRRKQQHDVNFYSPWMSCVASIFNNIGMQDIWLHEGNGFNNIYLKESVKLRISDIYKQTWHSDVQTHEYCDFYKILKNEWGQMKYLTSLNYYERKILCRWRCRNSSIPITSSRYLISDEIICPLCRNDSLGDELHYLFKCDFFYNDQIYFLGNIIDTHGEQYIINMLKVNDISTFCNYKSLLNFINLIMSIFKDKKLWDVTIDFTIENIPEAYNSEEEI